MILTCPACGTSYTVKDGAIPPQGRNVRCAACKHSWHQDGEEAPAPASAGPATTAPIEPEVSPPSSEPTSASVTRSPTDPVPSVEATDQAAEPAPDQPAEQSAAPTDEVSIPVGATLGTQPSLGGPVAMDGPRFESAAAVADEQPIASTDWNEASYDIEPAPAPWRKGPLIVLILVLLVAALAAAAWFFAPRVWMARVGLADASNDSPLKLMVTSQDRQKLASGNDLVSLSGRVINPTDSIQTVPALQADLRDGGGKLVYSWTIAPPASRLEPGASASFNAAELGVPADATSLTLRWAR